MNRTYLSPILQNIVTSIRNRRGKGPPQTVIFDMDSTLLSVSPRSQKILEHISHLPEIQKRFPEHYQQLIGVQIQHDDWGIRDAIERHQVKGPKDFFDFIRKNWFELFFSNQFLQFDEPYEGALNFVCELAKLEVEIIYLTGRDRPRMGQGTLDYLIKNNWPLKSNEHLIMKNDSKRHDEEFKAHAIQKLNLNYQHVCFFENEPVIINLVRKMIPDLDIIYVDTVHSGRAEPPKDLPTFLALKGYR